MRRELEPWLTGRTIMAAERIDAPPGPKYARLEEAAGARILGVRRRGKFLLLPLDGGGLLVVHLGMTGVITATLPAAHERVRLTLDEGSRPTLHFRDPRRFGRFLLLPDGDPRTLPTLATMGPEPLSDDFRADTFAAALEGSRTAIKTYLLSQRPVAGVGNIYADEALWRAGIHPATPANRLARKHVAPLRDAIRDVLRASIEAQGTTLHDYRTVNGEVGGFLERLAVYGHEHDPCPRCGHPVERIVLGARGTHLCPECQPRRGRRRRGGAHPTP